MDKREPFGGNGFRIGDTLVYLARFPRTRERLERQGVRTAVLDISETTKAEGAVTCCRLIFAV